MKTTDKTLGIHYPWCSLGEDIDARTG